MSDFKDLLDIANKFRDKRDWRQFHDPKNLAMCISTESAEVLEHFLWVSKDEMDNFNNEKKKMIADELVDTLHPILLLADYYKIDLVNAFKSKMKENEKKYPVSLVKGNHSNKVKMLKLQKKQQ